MAQLAKPNVLYHADGGSKDAKRWCTRATLGTDGRYTAFAPEHAEAALTACSLYYALLRPVLAKPKRRYPEGLSKPKESAKLRCADSECLAYYIASMRSSNWG
jgi:hypothetical protein